MVRQPRTTPCCTPAMRLPSSRRSPAERPEEITSTVMNTADNTMDPRSVDPTTLSLDDLRPPRPELQADDDALSYVRRLTQARLDLVLSEKQHRASGDDR